MILIAMAGDKDTKCTVNFDTGFLSTEEIEGIFESLPVDVSFVSAENEVHYFNREKDRVFKRTRSVIGKKVQNCHPEKSLAKVNQIIEDFRAGKREKAEFWINLHGQMVYIRYFPVRDRAGKYLGCLEVSQDITEIQKITGEKRLLDEPKEPKAVEYAEIYNGTEDEING
jgi:PAS domain S-box-containing protein